jgi:hypothetical protein
MGGALEVMDLPISSAVVKAVVRWYWSLSGDPGAGQPSMHINTESAAAAVMETVTCLDAAG